MGDECEWVEEFLGGLPAGAWAGTVWAEPPAAGAGAPGVAAGLERGGLASAELARGWARAEAHLAGCASCQSCARDLVRLDLLLASEPVPAPPAALAQEILSQVAARRRAEVAWARGRLAAACAACLVAGALLGLLGVGEAGPGWGSPEDWLRSLPAPQSLGAAALEGARARLETGASWVAGLSPPEGGWGVVWGLLPLLLIVNWALGRAPLRGPAGRTAEGVA